MTKENDNLQRQALLRLGGKLKYRRLQLLPYLTIVEGEDSWRKFCQYGSQDDVAKALSVATDEGSPQKAEEVPAEDKDSEKEKELDRMERKLFPELFDPNSPEYHRKPGETMAEYMEKLKKVPPKQYVYLEETPAPATDENMQKVLTGLEELKRQLPTRGDVKEGAEEGTTAAIERGRERYESEKEAKEAKAQFTREEIVTKFLQNLRHSSEVVRSARLGYCNLWLDFADRPQNQWTRELLIDYQEFLASPERNKGKGYSKATQGAIFNIVKQVFVAAGVDWPMGKRDGVRVRKSDMKTPSLKLSDVERMINAAKDGKLTIPQAAYLALSTVYGLRREELTRVGQEDIDYDTGRISVRTAKGGIEREHLLAGEIVPYLKKHNFNEKHSLNVLTGMYLSMEVKAGIAHIERAGYHSIRRPLDSKLLRCLPYVDVKRFLRWKMPTEMPVYYDKSDLVEDDSKVFKLHPFLPMWRG